METISSDGDSVELEGGADDGEIMESVSPLSSTESPQIIEANRLVTMQTSITFAEVI